ncbi:MAG: alanine--glyoxylate aminotransferase family protein [Proteobacteria bacterium]|nr:alanine--glyoxylate aminotransferase family protein [Burkholderiales bacterium]
MPESNLLLSALSEANPLPRLLMGPGPINADPRVLRAMSAPLLGQFDPQFRAFMRDTQALYRAVFETANAHTLCIDGTARSAIETVMVSLIEPGDRVLVASFGRFGQLKAEIARRVGADVRVLDAVWGTVFDPAQIQAAIAAFSPKLVACCQGDTSTTMLQPLADLGALCRRHGAMLQVDATASLCGTPLPVDAWQIDCVTGALQKCLAGPSGIAPITLSDTLGEVIMHRRHVEEGLRPAGYVAGAGRIIGSNYFDLAMIIDYWSERALNHHTEATTMLYAARECARIFLQEGAARVHARHALASRAVSAGLTAMQLKLFGDPVHRMPNVTGVWIPDGVDGERVRRALLEEFNIEIGTSFGPLQGRIWRIGTMGYNARCDAVLTTVAALETVLAGEHHRFTRGAGVDSARAVYREARGDPAMSPAPPVPAA